MEFKERNHLHNIKLQYEETNPDIKVAANYPEDLALKKKKWMKEASLNKSSHQHGGKTLHQQKDDSLKAQTIVSIL